MALTPPPYQTAAWYPDPEDSGRNRWWNGVAWTDDFQTSASTPTPAAASGPEEKLAEAKALIASMPEFENKPIPTLRAARLAQTRTVSYVLGFGIVAFGFAVVNLGDGPLFGILAVGSAVLAYGMFILTARLRFQRSRLNRGLAIAGGILASSGICFVILTATLGWHADFSAGRSGPTQAIETLAPVAPRPAQTHDGFISGTAADATRARLGDILVQVENAWQSAHNSTGLYPASASVEGGTVVTPDGSTGIAIPAGDTLGYTPNADRTDFVLTLKDAKGIGVKLQDGQLLGF